MRRMDSKFGKRKRELESQQQKRYIYSKIIKSNTNEIFKERRIKSTPYGNTQQIW